MNNISKVLKKRMFKDKIFYLCIIVTIIISLLIVLTNAPTMAEWVKAGDKVGLENCFYNFAPLIGIVFASFVSLFLGVEHSDGTLRNKIISGHKRSNIYISFFLISALGCIIISISYILPSLIGLCYLDFTITTKTFIIWTIIILSGTILYSVVFTIISVLITNKALSAVLCLVLWFILLFVGSIIVNTLTAPKMITDFVETDNEYIESDPYPNPNYVSGTKRDILQTICYIMPSCAVNQLANGELMGNEKKYVILQLLTTIIILASGCTIFSKKDLK